jgi:hypothetical protein
MSRDDGTKTGSALVRRKQERVLSPVERLSEVVFGLIMTLSVTGSLSVAESGKSDVRTMFIGALGCNTAWGIVDALMYLVVVLAERYRSLALFHAVRGEKDTECAHRMIADRLPPLIAASIRTSELEQLRRQFAETTIIPTAGLTRRHLLGAIGVFLLVFLTTLPVVLPFLLPVGPLRALRLLERSGRGDALRAGVPARQVRQPMANRHGGCRGRDRRGARRAHHRTGGMRGTLDPPGASGTKGGRKRERTEQGRKPSAPLHPLSTLFHPGPTRPRPRRLSAAVRLRLVRFCSRSCSGGEGSPPSRQQHEHSANRPAPARSSPHPQGWQGARSGNPGLAGAMGVNSALAYKREGAKPHVRAHPKGVREATA